MNVRRIVFGSALMTGGQAARIALQSSCIAGIAIGAGFGVAGVATGYAVMSLAMMPVGYVVAARLLAIPMRRIAAILAAPLIATSAMIAVVMAVVAVMRQDG